MSGVRGVERRLYQQVAEQIRDMILRAPFPSGSRLPAERDLAQQLGVSRPSLREALIALELEGTVEIRMGSGVYVTAASGRRTKTVAATGESPLELMEARATIEPAIVGLAAARFTPEALAALSRTVEAMRADIEEGRRPLEHDRQFHATIAAQTGNSVVVHLVTDLFDGRHSPISSQFRVRFDTAETWRAALAEHEAILAALEARDTLLAQMRMHAHLDESKRRWMESEPR